MKMKVALVSTFCDEQKAARGARLGLFSFFAVSSRRPAKYG
jgi:hypothetical protein